MVLKRLSETDPHTIYELVSESAKKNNLKDTINIDQIVFGLKTLNISNFLYLKKDKYRFQIPVFPKVILRQRNISALISDYWRLYEMKKGLNHANF